jgi:hypothetical protein
MFTNCCECVCVCVCVCVESKALSQVLYQWLRKSSTITKIDLSGSQISGDTLVFIKEAAKHNANLGSLVLRGLNVAKLKQDKQAELLFLRGLLACMVSSERSSDSTDDGSIRDIDINNYRQRQDFKVSDVWAKVIAQGIRGTRVGGNTLVCTVVHLNLASNRITTEGAIALCQALKENSMNYMALWQDLHTTLLTIIIACGVCVCV